MQRQIKCKEIKDSRGKSDERDSENENYSACELHFVLPIWLFGAYVQMNLDSAIISLSSMHDLHSFGCLFMTAKDAEKWS